MNTNFISPILQERETIWATNKLFVFNPEHDLALGVGQGSYTPPAEVVKIRKEKSLLPALFADNGDFILLMDYVSEADILKLPYTEYIDEKNLHIVFPQDLRDISKYVSLIVPWGWDHAIHRILFENGMPVNLLPTEQQLAQIRNLSHRRNVIPFRIELASLLNEEPRNLPQELFTTEEVEKYLDKHGVAFFKAPWSSSGRGLIVSDHITKKGLMEWCHGTIKHQGSVMGEPVWSRELDFATEWDVKNGEPKFMGVSVFKASSRGKYHGNILLHQNDLHRLIKEKASGFDDRMLEAQKEVLKQQISPFYEGYLGIDMLVDTNGQINPCVELNLRLTMGHVALMMQK